MNQLEIVLHPAALEEAQAAARWYTECNRSVADAFVTSLDTSLVRIQNTPDTFPQYINGTRRYVMSQFPYSIVYRVHLSVIQVIALAHMRRRPGYWHAR